MDAALEGVDWRRVLLENMTFLPWRLEARVGRSKCLTYKLRVLRDPELRDAPVVGYVHITMNGKVEPFRLPLHVAAPLIGALLEAGRDLGRIVGSDVPPDPALERAEVVAVAMPDVREPAWCEGTARAAELLGVSGGEQ